LKRILEIVKIYLFRGFKNLIPKGLMARSLLIIVLPLIIIQVVTTFVFFQKHWERVSWRLATLMRGDISTILELMEKYPDKENQKFLFYIAEREMMVKIQILEKIDIKNIPHKPQKSITVDALRKSLLDLKHPVIVENASFFDEEIKILVGLDNNKILEIKAPLKRFFSMSTYLWLGLMILTSIIVFIIAMIFMKNQVRAVNRLAEAADMFGRGQDAANFKPDGAKEVRLAGRAFLIMKDRIKRQVNERTNMLSAVSHDLRTPLTRIKIQLAMLPQTEETKSLLQDADEMQNMLNAYLKFSKGEEVEGYSEVNLADFINKIAAKFKNKNIKINDKSFNVIIKIKENMFSRCIVNIIENALKYAKNIEIILQIRQDSVEIIIDDDGPGIPSNKRAEMLKAFTRLDDSRNKDTGGIGLGMAIAQDIVNAHGGRLFLEDSSYKGLRVRISIPL
jgi:two-component system osmolarity sensor histidine kinase EnvZ